MGNSSASLPFIVGRYALYEAIGSGGMATVHSGCLLGPAGFSRTVAIKRLHAQYAKDPEFVAMFLDEARMAARIRHPNVVPTLDVVARDGELFLVMDYVQGEPLARLVRAASTKNESIPVDIVSAILCGVLHGLHAAHEATNDRGEPMEIVHRDVSPQNVLVGADGIPRVLDFGVAKAVGRLNTTRDGHVKGKLAYMAPEQLRAGTIDRRTDVFAAGILLWETLTLKRLFGDASEGLVVTNVLERPIPPPSTKVRGLPGGLDAVVLRALERSPPERFASAREMARALDACVPTASVTRVAEWIEGLAGDVLKQRAQAMATIERKSSTFAAPPGQDDAPTAAATPPTPAVPTGLSQVSTISVSTTHPKPRVASGGRRLTIALLAGAAGLLILGGTVARRGFGDAAGPAPIVAGTPASALEDVQPPPALPSSGSTSSGPSPVPTTAPSARSPKTASPSTKPCTIHTYLDDAGITHFTKACK